MADEYQYDVAVIGAGPGGYVAGIRAAQLGAKACVIEKGKLGGVCTNVGCIPTKALWQAARTLLDAQAGEQFGVGASDVKIDYAATGKHRDKVVKTLRGGVEGLLKANKVDLIRGEASFADPHTLEVKGGDEDSSITARNIIIATGSKPFELPATPFDHDVVIDSSDAVTANELPESVIVVGGGYIGIEFAGIYSVLGVEVTVVEALDRLLPALDADCAAEVTKALKKRGVEVVTGQRVEEMEKTDGGVRVKLSGGDAVEAQKMLVCVGRKPDCSGLDVEKAGLETGEKGELSVNEHLQTSKSHIYAIGDVNGKALLAHVASQEAVVAAAHLTGTITTEMDYRVVPAVVFSFPEIGLVGLSEEEAKAEIGEITVKKFPFRALGKAHIAAATDGFVKMICEERTGRIVGVAICGEHASDLLGEACLAVKLECTAEEMSETIHAHPTMPESVREAAEGVIGMPINWRG